MGYTDINLKILAVPKGGNMMDHFHCHFLKWILMIQENVDQQKKWNQIWLPCNLWLLV